MFLKTIVLGEEKGRNESKRLWRRERRGRDGPEEAGAEDRRSHFGEGQLPSGRRIKWSGNAGLAFSSTTNHGFKSGKHL